MVLRALLMDIDGTLFDFDRSSFAALQKAFGEMGLDFTENDWPVYSAINTSMWKAFERGEMEKDFLYLERFRKYFSLAGIDADVEEMNARYLEALSYGAYLMPHCEQALMELKKRCKIFVVTNGDAYSQKRRVSLSGVAGYFDRVFISEELGCKKPERAYFDQVFAAIGEEYRNACMIVGDSLSSDMQGGRNAGIPTCFYGKNEDADERCDYIIHDLLELIGLVDGMQG